MYISIPWYDMLKPCVGLCTNFYCQLVGRPLVDDSMLINYLTNRYEVSLLRLFFPSVCPRSNDHGPS